MKTKYLLLLSILVLLFIGNSSSQAQTAPPFKISAIKVVPFEELTGEFGEEITAKNTREFFNEVSTGLLITVVVSGQTDATAENRRVETTVTSGSKILAKKSTVVFSVGAGGKYFVPLYVDAGLCQPVTITAKITGQKTAATMTRKLSFTCGE